MSSHYYTSKPDVAHDYQEIDYTFLSQKLSFVTDANVFSKDRVDFGSSLLIQSMQIGPTDTVLDLGCGYGPIGICASKLATEGKVLMVDVNERALELTKKNIEKNNSSNATVRMSDGVDGVQVEEKFHVVLTNPPIRAGKDKVFQFYEGAYEHLLPGGDLWVVIQKKQGAESTEKKLQELFEKVDMVRQEKGYRIYRANKQIT